MAWPFAVEEFSAAEAQAWARGWAEAGDWACEGLLAAMAAEEVEGVALCELDALLACGRAGPLAAAARELLERRIGLACADSTPSSREASPKSADAVQKWRRRLPPQSAFEAELRRLCEASAEGRGTALRRNDPATRPAWLVRMEWDTAQRQQRHAQRQRKEDVRCRLQATVATDTVLRNLAESLEPRSEGQTVEPTKVAQ